MEKIHGLTSLLKDVQDATRVLDTMKTFIVERLRPEEGLLMCHTCPVAYVVRKPSDPTAQIDCPECNEKRDVLG